MKENSRLLRNRGKLWFWFGHRMLLSGPERCKTTITDLQGKRKLSCPYQKMERKEISYVTDFKQRGS
jgi:hypothetical protein